MKRARREKGFVSPLYWVCASLVVVALLLVAAIHAAHEKSAPAPAADPRAATALLLTPHGSASAFCISESGMFLTYSHALDDITGDIVTLILAPTEKDEKTYPAKIIARSIGTADVAVLQIAADRKLPALKIGDALAPTELQHLRALGCPRLLEADIREKVYGPVAEQALTVNSVRKSNGAPSAIEFTPGISRGFRGGPVLDDSDHVVAIGARDTDSFAIPASRFADVLQAPIITVSAPHADNAHRTAPVQFSIGLQWLTASPEKAKVSLQILGDGPPRGVDAYKASDGKYYASIVPARPPDPAHRVKLEIHVWFPAGEISGTVLDRTIKIGDQSKNLADIETIERAPDGQSFFADGAPAGNLAGLDALTIDVGGATAKIDTRTAGRIKIIKPDVPLAPLSYKALVKLENGKEFSSVETRIEDDPPAPAATTAPPGQSTTLPDDSLAVPRIVQGHVDLPAQRDIPLPAPITDIVAAEHGRTLLVYMKGAHKVAVFAVIDLKIRGFIDVNDDNALVAGGARYALVVRRGENVIDRYSLATLQKERSFNSSEYRQAFSLTMGRSSPGIALLVSGADQDLDFNVLSFDAETMSVAATAPRAVADDLGRPSRMTVRASADGHRFGVCRDGTSPSGFTILDARGDTISRFYEHEDSGVLVPGADGSEIYTTASGVFTHTHGPVLATKGNWARGTAYVPSYHPLYFLGIPYSTDKKGPKIAGIYLKDTTTPLLELANAFPALSPAKIVQSTNRNGKNPDPLTPDKRFHFYPQLNLILTIPPANDKIVAHPIDIHALLEQKGAPYLYVTSVPPFAETGTRYHYQLETASHAGGVKFALQTGPAGLTVSESGEVTWDTSPQPTDKTVEVSLQDASGETTHHTFHIVVTD